MNINEKLGKKITSLRKKREWSLEKLALEANIDRTYIPEIEKGKRNISIAILEKLAIAFEVEVYELLKF